LTCPRCRATMREEKRTFHKQRKWVCLRCEKVRMQQSRKTGG